MNFHDGYIPDQIQARRAHEFGFPSDREKVLELAAPWDVSDVPPVVTWASFASVLDEQSHNDVESAGLWWQGIDVETYFTPSQSYRPNCAGFAMANAYQTRLLVQKKYLFSEQVVEKINPMGTWNLSKDGSVNGGQTISAIMTAGQEFGNFTAKDVGEYDCSANYSLYQKKKSEANKRQVGFSIYEGQSSEAADRVLQICKCGFAVVIGNAVAVAGSEKDANGVVVARLGGHWSHATSFCGYKKIGTTEYVLWINSHGNIYLTEDAPRFACWMDFATLRRFCDSFFCDIAAVFSSEAPYDPNLKSTLLPVI